jgi:nitrite reductase/ring-hydroxylating ferredoxin subunit
MLFRYRNKIHAIDHNCPHRNYPLSRGSIYDIEDFGIVLSAGITCPGHGWAFDINTGQCSRGAYQLGVWETEIRPSDSGEEEVWVRRREM